MAATAGGAANEIFVWDAASGTAVNLAGKGLPVLMVGYARDNRSIAFGLKKRAQARVNAYGELQRKFIVDPSNPYRIGLGPSVTRDADYFTAQTKYAAGSTSYELRSVPGPELDDQILEVVRNADRQRIERDKTSGYRHTAYTFTHDGRYFITAGWKRVFIAISNRERKEGKRLHRAYRFGLVAGGVAGQHHAGIQLR